MPHRFESHSFSPEMLRNLRSAFDSVWAEVEQHATVSKRDAVREAIALALIDLAKGGRCDPEALHRYGRDRAFVALQALDRTAAE